MQVCKRDNSLQALDISKIVYRIDRLIRGLDDQGHTVAKALALDANSIALNVCQHVKDQMQTTELDEITAEDCAYKVLENPEYDELAKRLVISNNHKNSRDYRGMLEMTTMINTGGRLSKDYVQRVSRLHDQLDQAIRFQRDYEYFDYFGYKTLEKNYLIRGKDKNGHIVLERPQHMWMRVALELHRDNLEQVLKTYHRLSEFYYVHATPTLFNSGHVRNQLSSCFLGGIPDSIENMYESVRRLSHISKNAGGIGCWISDIRGNNAVINSSGGIGSGIIPYIRSLNDLAKHVDQGGKRKGSIALYLEPHHPDVFEFLELRKNNGNEEFRTRDIFLALVIPDLFMSRIKQAILNRSSGVKSEIMWSLMCPKQCPGLTDSFGDDFARLYNQYELEGRYIRQVKILDLWNQILNSQMETSLPYMMYKDAANRKSNQKNLGVIKSSNLCVSGETLILTDHGEQPIKDLSGKTVKLWNGLEWSEALVNQTGVNQAMLEVSFENGRSIQCTPYHKFYLKGSATATATGSATASSYREVIASDLKVGDSVETCHINQLKQRLVSGLTRVRQVVKLPELMTTYCFNEPNRHMGVFNGILAGNCIEIMQYSSYDEVSSCNLASICLPKFVNSSKPHGYDLELLAEISGELVRNLNCVIDQGFCPTPQIKRSNLRHRPIGIGVQGLADVFFKLKYPYESTEAQQLNSLIAEAIYYGAVRASVALARERSTNMQGLQTLSEEARAKLIYDVGRLDLLENQLYDFKRSRQKISLKVEENHIAQMSNEITNLRSNVTAILRETVPGFLEQYNLYELQYLNVDDNSNRWGAYSSFMGSPASQGQLQQDLWDQYRDYPRTSGSQSQPTLTLVSASASASTTQLATMQTPFDWKSLTAEVVKFGLRNSLLTAFMPTASTAQIMGNNECFEPITTNVYSRTVLSGNFMIVNKYLQRDLTERKLWTKEMREEILRARGSVQNIERIPPDLKQLYKTSWEISKKTYLKMSADRGRFIDQSQSLNLFISDPTDSLLTTIHLYGWELGLKTGMYYLRRRTVSTAQQFTLDPIRKGDSLSKTPTLTPSTDECNNEEGCLMCSA